VEQILSDSAVDLGDPGDDDVYGHGRINAAAAIAMASDYAGAPNQPPVASATATPQGTYAPLPVVFDGSLSTDDGFISSYAWDFGDGNRDSGVQVTHTYNVADVYDAVLTVTDDRGATGTVTVSVVVESDPSALFPPANLSAAVDANTVTLTWDDNNGAETGYQIERAKKARGKYAYSLLATTGPDAQQYVDEPGETGNYRYRMRAVNGSEVSEYSPAVAVTIESVGTDPEPDPGTLAAPVLSYSVAGAEVNVTWTHSCPADAMCSYSVERGDQKTKGNINFAEVYSGSASSVTFTEDTRGTFYYRVNATDGTSVSGYSNTVTVRIR
jgi:PKD repeat protein